MPLRRPAAIAFAAGLVVIVGGTAGLLLTRHSTPVLRPVAAGVAALPAPTAPIVAPPQPAQAEPVARPASLTIPLIGVKTHLITLGLAGDGSMQVPASTAVAGWFTGSPRPGSVGSSIIVGHVDSETSHGVFYRLSELKAGNDVFVKRADGTTAEFRVTRVQTYLKDQFPTQTVYGPVPDAELRLITCGGAFDSAAGHYLSNIVVYATEVKLAPGRQGPGSGSPNPSACRSGTQRAAAGCPVTPHANPDRRRGPGAGRGARPRLPRSAAAAARRAALLAIAGDSQGDAR